MSCTPTLVKSVAAGPTAAARGKGTGQSHVGRDGGWRRGASGSRLSQAGGGDRAPATCSAAILPLLPAGGAPVKRAPARSHRLCSSLSRARAVGAVLWAQGAMPDRWGMAGAGQALAHFRVQRSTAPSGPGLPLRPNSTRRSGLAVPAIRLPSGVGTAGRSTLSARVTSFPLARTGPERRDRGLGGAVHQLSGAMALQVAGAVLKGGRESWHGAPGARRPP